jgi:ppGpp synthetase/RelA/SpoT-type nucleotidyltranferase
MNISNTVRSMRVIKNSITEIQTRFNRYESQLDPDAAKAIRSAINHALKITRDHASKIQYKTNRLTKQRDSLVEKFIRKH